MGLIKQLFYQGDYAQVLAKAYDQTRKINKADMPYILGSLSFLGRTEECQALFDSQKKVLSDEQKSYGHFFLALGWTRRSHYKKAKQHLLQNKALDASAKQKNASIHFLVTQGISFFLYYLGQFEKSQMWSKKSLRAAMKQENIWMKSLSLDLFGNNLVQIGRINEGVGHLQNAVLLAKKIGNQALSHAIETSCLIYLNEYGIGLENSFQELQTKYQLSLQKDNFTRSNLGLELSRQLMVRGQFRAAGTVLEVIAPLIYKAQNRRQEVRLNLRWAELSFLRNELSTALHFIRSGKKSLNFVDQTYEIQLLGIEIKILRKIDGPASTKDLAEKLLVLSKTFHLVKNENILARDYDQVSQKLKSSDDEIHQMLLKASQSPEQARKIIIKTSFFSWLYRFLPIAMGEKYILLNFEQKSMTCIDSNLISHKPGELSSLNYKILCTLAEGFKTKQQLLETIWGYTYDPLRHDSLIYSAFSNLRKTLGEHAGFLETTELGYHLKAQVFDYAVKSKSATAPTLLFKPPTAPISYDRFLKAGLNSRQIQILKYLEQNQFIAVKNTQKLFSISEITANRDLRALYEKNFVLRIGQGRATQYALT
ncbi:MAG: DeoR family transcriptional regulator [Bdellovibrionaceae bacterium]|nr:DeoR family transcriptional regulator [Bdellovibrio sp.]